MFVSDGRQRPCKNNFSETPFKYDGKFSKTGCKCIGFHNGLASILSFSKASLSFSLLNPIFLESIKIQDNQAFEKEWEFSFKILAS